MFVHPGTDKPATVSQFSVMVGYINNPGSTQMTMYNKQGGQLGVFYATDKGFNQFYSDLPGAAYFAVYSVAGEPAGWELNTIQIGPIDDNYTALADSYSSGEGTFEFSISSLFRPAWPVTSCAPAILISSASLRSVAAIPVIRPSPGRPRWQARSPPPQDPPAGRAHLPAETSSMRNACHMDRGRGETR